MSTKLPKYMHLIIDPEFEALIPPLSDDEFKQLRENIIETGECRDPLVVWYIPRTQGDYILLDGHNRWKVIQEFIDTDSPIQFTWVSEILFSREEAKAWMIRNQLGRRNLPNYERARLALQLKPLLAEEAKKRQATSTGGANPQLVQKSAPAENSKVRDELAKAAGVSHDTIHKVEVIEEKAAPEVKEQLRKGEVSINKAYGQVADKKPAQMRRAGVTFDLTKSDLRALKQLSKDLHLGGKDGEDNQTVFRFMLDYFKQIVKEANEWKESAEDFVPEPSCGAVRNYLQSIDTTDALAGEIVFSSHQFAGNTWQSIVYNPHLSATPKQKEEIASALEKSTQIIRETYQSLMGRQLNNDK